MAHSSTSPTRSKKTQTVHFRATFQTAEIALVAKIRTLHQHNVELSIKNLKKKRSYNSQEKMTARNQVGRNDEVDHFRVEYASRILFHDMNLDKAETIRKSNAIRLSKPSSFLLSPYCQIDSKDIDTV
ncbi:uncharacterized protein LOC127747665 [Arachis duranensis]|uniref:Uncharacterized protein LOC127747665 n=1 Tax=Arachis duranensis TaxID=130453 RepID=A0A9C6TYC0_ARADU|nr:uncharacterized protein LOC127747665 [Arachis duranensis]